jgi:hypothetical protein
VWDRPVLDAQLAQKFMELANAKEVVAEFIPVGIVEHGHGCRCAATA